MEALIHCFWDTLEEDSTLTTPDQECVRILSPGTWNRGGEPDFVNARILFQGRELQGDVVLHEKVSDYIAKGHLAQGHFDNVILHVFTAHHELSPEEAAELKDGPLGHLIHCVIPTELLYRNPNPGSCRFFPCMSTEKIREYFHEAGRERLQQKSILLLEEMIASGVERAFCKGLLLAAGNKYNKESFGELFRRIREYDQSEFRLHYKALLWGESTLLADPAAHTLPEENRKEARILWDEFWAYRLTSREKINWQQGRIRPFNSPERRIAMICAFLDKFGLQALEVFAEELRKKGAAKFAAAMKQQLILSDAFWDWHCTFRSSAMKKKAAVLGEAQARILMTDAIAPALLAYGKLHNDPLLEKEASSLTEFLAPDCKLPQFRKSIKQWFPEREEEVSRLFDNACLVQGVLYTADRYCQNCGKTRSGCLPTEL